MNILLAGRQGTVGKRVWASTSTVPQAISEHTRRVRFVRRDPIGSALLVAGVAEVIQFPDRVVLVGLDQLTTAIP